MSKPREIVPAASSAGFDDIHERARATRGLPFDPHDLAAKKEDLGAALADISDVEVLHRMQRFDTRITAAPFYERRVKELTQATASEEE